MVDVVLDGPGVIPVAAVVALAGVYIQFTSLINHDVAWFLYSVEAWFDGGRLYQDVFSGADVQGAANEACEAIDALN